MIFGNHYRRGILLGVVHLTGHIFANSHCTDLLSASYGTKHGTKHGEIMTHSATLPPEVIARMTELMQSGELQLPPPVFLEMGGEFVAFDAVSRSLTVRFPVQERFQNPMGYMQGGMIAAAVDNVIGPLSFMVAPPNVTKTLEMTYLRPVPASLEQITVTARLVAAEGRELLFEAEVRRGADTMLAKAVARHHIIRPRGN